MSPTLKCDFIYFDLGNVLLHFDHAIASRKLSALASITEKEVHDLLFASGLQNEYETGLFSSEALVQRLSEAVGQPLPATETLQAVADIFWPNDDILPCLNYVRDRNLPTGLLSNTCDAHWKWIRSKRYSMVEGWFDFHILSFEVGAMKPSSKIYLHATEMAKTAPENILFIDDRMDNIVGAQQAGWQTIHFVGAEQLLTQLKHLLPY